MGNVKVVNHKLSLDQELKNVNKETLFEGFSVCHRSLSKNRRQRGFDTHAVFRALFPTRTVSPPRSAINLVPRMRSYKAKGRKVSLFSVRLQT